MAAREAAVIRVKNPGPEVPVQLRPIGTLRIEAQPGGDGTLWRARIVEGSTGLAVPVGRRQNPGGSEWIPVPAGGLLLRLPAGSYTVEGAGPGGVSASRTVTVATQRQSSVDLDAASRE